MGVYLLPMTAEMYHKYFKEYQNDLDLYIDKNAYAPYTYDEEKVNRYIQRQIELKRKTFAIMYGQEMVGEIVIKNIVPGECATMGLAMKNAKYKDRGFGTRAEQLAIQYVFHELEITYWCNRAEVVGDKYLGEYASEQISRGGELRLYDCESNAVYTLTLDKFLRGLATYVSGCYDIAVDGGRVDPGQIDAEGADCIIQYAIFDDVIYG